MRWAALLLLCSCEWGPWFDDACGDVDEGAARNLAADAGVLDVFNRFDFFCESRAAVELDCRNPTAEACTLWLGSAVSRGRGFFSSEADEGLMPLLEHEMRAHWGAPVDSRDTCAAHPPTCDGAP